MLNAGPRGQFPRWRRSRKRLSVCSVLRCPDLWLQCSVSFVHGLEKTHCNHRSGHLKTEHTESLFLLRRHLGNWPRGPALSMRNLDSFCCWRCMLCPCKVRNKFLINFWNHTILLCIPCTCRRNLLGFFLENIFWTYNTVKYYVGQKWWSQSDANFSLCVLLSEGCHMSLTVSSHNEFKTRGMESFKEYVVWSII